MYHTSTMAESAERTFATRPGQGVLNSILSTVRKPPTLYHYTTQRGFLGIIQTQELWATDHQCLNDTREFVHAKEVFYGEIEEMAKRANADPLLAEMKSTLTVGRGFEEVNLYVASLSVEADSLTQWRAYGGSASGFSLGFDTAGIEAVLPSNFRLVPCIYDEKEQRKTARSLVAAILDQLRQNPKELTELPNVTPYVEVLCRTELHTVALLFKHKKFEEEMEWRIISSEPMMEDVLGWPSEGGAPLEFREGKSILTPYRRVPLGNSSDRIPLAEVVVGPNPSPEQSVRSVRSLLKNQSINACCRVSEVPYRNW